MTDVTDETSSTASRRFPSFLLGFAILMAAVNQEEILAALGYPEAGPPRWILAGLLAAAFTTWAFVTSDDRSRVFGSYPLTARLITALSYLSTLAFVFWVFADLLFSSPVFWAIAALFIVTDFVHYRDKRARGSAQPMRAVSPGSI